MELLVQTMKVATHVIVLNSGWEKIAIKVHVNSFGHEPLGDKNNNLRIRQGLIQTRLYSQKLAISDLRRKEIALSMQQKQRC